MLKRLLYNLITLFLVLSLTFVLLRLLPGGPFDQERRLPPKIQANIEAQYHLNAPLYEQYGLYLKALLKGDLGPSYKYLSRSVNDMIGDSFWVSFEIGLYALLMGVPLGVMLGTIAGATHNRWLDRTLSLLGISALSVPSFIFGGFLILVFALKLKWLPPAQLESPLHYLMPVFSLSLVPFAYSFMLIRNQVKDLQSAGYVATKQSFGLAPTLILFKHILRNALQPLLAILGPMAAAIVTGSFAVEYIFAIPGLGKHFIDGVSNRDYPLVTGITLVFSLVLIGFNFLTDVAREWLDPRLKEGLSE